MKAWSRVLPALVATAALVSASAFAQSWPNHQLTLVIPFPPAGPTDAGGRILAERLGVALGQTVVVENKAGANGGIGVQQVARAAPDGYTLLLGTGGTHGVNPSLYANPGYDPIASFAPVAWLMSTPNIIVVNASFPARTVPELIALAKKQPGLLSFAVPGIGSTPHMAGELFKRTADIDIRSVPYRGSAAALVDVIAGQLPIMFDGIPSSLPHINSGRLRAIAVTGSKRAPELPNVPTVAESIPGFDVTAWYGIYAPAGTPPAVIARLNTEIDRILNDPEVKKRYAALGAETVGGSTEKLREQVQREVARWAALIKANNIKAE